jgi:hypothetical protein
MYRLSLFSLPNGVIMTLAYEFIPEAELSFDFSSLSLMEENLLFFIFGLYFFIQAKK